MHRYVETCIQCLPLNQSFHAASSPARQLGVDGIALGRRRTDGEGCWVTRLGHLVSHQHGALWRHTVSYDVITQSVNMQSFITLHYITYNVSQKRPTTFFVHNFSKCWPILTILWFLDTAKSLQYNIVIFLAIPSLCSHTTLWNVKTYEMLIYSTQSYQLTCNFHQTNTLKYANVESAVKLNTKKFVLLTFTPLVCALVIDR